MHLFVGQELDSRCLCGAETWASIADLTILEHMWKLPAKEQPA